ncbi:caspase family protein [Oscillatoria sp. HE19RPO]|uniref:nSTAND1 domain-containing NTPase n=1 Tax=Oscillatoria sp. HE19RPO TaxID=2954806 RepID=UPI0020C2F07E|nr:caspase family protein [Oscillatoria sp. HE19RPO]
MKRALVVGINCYRKLGKLRTPANDANAVAQGLREIGFDEIRGLPSAPPETGLWVDPENKLLSKELENAIEWLFAIDEDKSNIPETALLFFAGHGLRYEKGNRSKGFLATSNSSNNDSKDKWYQWGVSLVDLRQILEQSPVKRQIVILDCCNAGEVFNYKEIDPGNSEIVTRCLMSACAANQPAFEPIEGEHSYFTATLLEGWQQSELISTYTLWEYIDANFKYKLQDVRRNDLNNQDLYQKPKCSNRNGELILFAPEVYPGTHPDIIEKGSNPYKGLEAFQEADAPYFFGRGQLTISLVNLIHDKPFLAVSGSSGSGKSSVVRAGLIPELKKGSTFSETATWKIYEPFKPGNDPLDSLAQVLVDENLSLEQVNAELALGAKGLQRLISQTKRPCVLVVDQFEQLFTPSPSEDKQRQFLDCLCGAIDSDSSPTQGDEGEFSLRVVITIRDDFLGKCAEYPQLLKLINTNKEIVGSMKERELREAISLPAQKVGCEIPPDLENLMVADVQKSPGSLPLLQDLLQQMFTLQYKERRPLTVQTYQDDDIGGVQKALQNRANKLYNSLTDDQKKIAKSIFLELTQLVESTTPTARQVRKSQLTDLPPSPKQVETVLDQLEAARLIVTRELQARGNKADKITVVDVAHESLMSNWEQLKQWVKENPEVKRQRDEIQAKAQDWEDKGKRREGLLRGLDLVEVEVFERNHGNTFPPSGLVREFVRESREESDRLEKEEEERQQRELNLIKETLEQEKKATEQETKARKAAQSRTAVALVSTLVVGVVAIFATVQRIEAQRQATIASLGEKAARAKNLLSSPQPIDGLVLAIQATRESQDKLGQVLTAFHDSLLTGIQTVREQNRIQGHQGWVNAVAFSPEGETIVSGSNDRTLRLWNQKGEPIGESSRRHQGSVNAVAFSPNGKYIVSASDDKTLRLWNPNGQLITELLGHQLPINAVAISTDGETIVSSSNDGTVHLWDRTGKWIGELPVHENIVEALAISPDGQYIVSGTASLFSFGTLRLWNRKGQLISEQLRAHKASVEAVTISPDGEYIVSGGADNVVRLWSFKWELIAELRGHKGLVYAVAISPDSQTIVSGSMDNTLRLWNRQGELIQVLRGHQDWINAVAISPDGEYIVSGSKDHSLRLWNHNEQPMGKSIPIHEDEDTAKAISPDGEYIVSGSSNDNILRLWNHQGQMIEELRGHSDRVRTVTISPDGEYILSGSYDKTLRLWNRNGQEIGVLQSHQNTDTALAISPDGEYIVISSSNDNILRLWNRVGQEIGVLQGHQGKVNAVAISPDGQTIVSGSYDNTLRLWNRNAQLITELRGHQDEVNVVAFSPDGQYIVSGSKDQTLRLWNRNGQPIGEPWRGHQKGVSAVAVSPDGETIVSGSWDGILRLWNRNGQTIGEPWRGHQYFINAVAFSPEGESIVSGGNSLDSSSYTLRLWPMGWKNWLQIGCNQLQYHPVLVAPETDVAREAGETCQKYAWNQTESAQFLVRQGKALAREGDIEGAVANFKQAKKLDATLNLEPEAEAKRLAVPVLLEAGKDFAGQGEYNEAVAKFQQALTLDPTLDLEPEAERLAVPVLLARGEQGVKDKQYKAAVEAYTTAQNIDATVEISAQTWNNLCWYGSLGGEAGAVMPACEQAVTLEPEDAVHRGNRGIAKALTGDKEGAIQDFQAFIELNENEATDEQAQGYINALRAGENPFTDAEIKRLLGE